MTTSAALPRLGGLTDLAREFGTSTVSIWRWTKLPGFPEPVARPAAGALYDIDAVRRWKADRES